MLVRFQQFWQNLGGTQGMGIGMRKALASLTVALVLGWSGAAIAQDVQKGWDAYQAGDYTTAFPEFRELAEQGHAWWQTMLGVMYAKGQGVVQNDAEALRWYRLAAEQGDVEAQFNVGTMYGDGLGVAQNYGEAVKWYRLAAMQGHAPAQSNLGRMYDTGRGVAQDFVIAHMWFNIAVESGDSGAEIYRDSLELDMTSADIAEAEKLARDWLHTHTLLVP